ncbi:hypothetical protein [Legionella drancourtii]|uniref:Membrane-associated HD superfamily hydrolase n=1 Tax=Legionella drancourtii LLAP12 TaxID=658187 RepID=G9ERI8_9GAMM|nr:hypothetical protein [Legionella drancourtii]EHL30157.1 hypothetical protein LDG_7903 [Legionella drancourtii LLAP12]
MAEPVDIIKKQSVDIIKKNAEEHAMQATLIAKQKLRNDEANRRMRSDEDLDKELKDKGFTTDERGNMITLWKKLMREAERAINEGQHAYNDWRSSMMSLLELCSLFLKALSQSRDELLNPVTKIMKQTFREQVLYPLKDKIMDAIRGQPRGDLPTLVHDLTMSDDNKLKIGEITFGDGSRPTSDDPNNLEKFNNAFATLVTLWLKDNGYELAADNTFVTTDEHQTVLTKEKFEELKDDEGNGLNAFLDLNTQLEFRPR